jgi:N-acetylmuramate 1-kinase
MIPHDKLIAFARKNLRLPEDAEVEFIPFDGRGSDRSYYRFRWRHKDSAILIHYEPTRIENAYYADIAGFLSSSNIPVPEILHHDKTNHLIIMQDLGDNDLWSYRNEPWEVRRTLYHKTLKIAHRLHTCSEQQVSNSNVKLMDPFGSELYHWERDYFLNHFVKALCGIELASDDLVLLERELSELAGSLLRHKRTLVHRDFQSQNVMIYNDEPFLIDFQGMRFGTRFYDLGSILCDPYVDFKTGEHEELLRFSYELSVPEFEWKDFQKAFWEASAQRLMQALGAYGFLGLTKGLKNYLAHVPTGLRNLRTAAEQAGSLPHLLETCNKVMPS